MYSINFTVTKNKFCLSLHYNGANRYLFVNGEEIVKIKAKDSAMVVARLRLENISKDWSVNNMKKKTRLSGYVYEFCADYMDINTSSSPVSVAEYLLSFNRYFMLKYKI